MAEKRKSDPGGDQIGASSSEGGPSPDKNSRPEQTAKSRGPSPDVIYVKISEYYRTKFRRYATEAETKENDAIENIIKYLGNLSSLDRTKILKGGTTPTNSLAAAIELIQWGDHAQMKSRWEWCVKIYGMLLYRNRGVPEIERLSLYKIGYSILSLANEMQEEVFDALSQSHRVDPEKFAHIEKCIELSKKYNNKFLTIGEHRIGHYNLACANSLLAETLVLGATDWDSDEEWVKDTIRELGRKRQNVRGPADRGPWRKVLGTNWRKQAETKNAFRKRIDTLLTSSLNELEKACSSNESNFQEIIMIPDFIVSDSNQSHGHHKAKPQVIPSEPRELKRASESDADLEFLRSDEDSSKEYDTWLAKNKEGFSSFDTFNALWPDFENPDALVRDRNT